MPNGRKYLIWNLGIRFQGNSKIIHLNNIHSRACDICWEEKMLCALARCLTLQNNVMLKYCHIHITIQDERFITPKNSK